MLKTRKYVVRSGWDKDNKEVLYTCTLDNSYIGDNSEMLRHFYTAHKDIYRSIILAYFKKYPEDIVNAPKYIKNSDEIKVKIQGD
jgi:replicative DNA helicase